MHTYIVHAEETITKLILELIHVTWWSWFTILGLLMDEKTIEFIKAFDKQKVLFLPNQMVCNGFALFDGFQ